MQMAQKGRFFVVRPRDFERLRTTNPANSILRYGSKKAVSRDDFEIRTSFFVSSAGLSPLIIVLCHKQPSLEPVVRPATNSLREFFSIRPAEAGRNPSEGGQACSKKLQTSREDSCDIKQCLHILPISNYDSICVWENLHYNLWWGLWARSWDAAI